MHDIQPHTVIQLLHFSTDYRGADCNTATNASNALANTILADLRNTIVVINTYTIPLTVSMILTTVITKIYKTTFFNDVHLLA